MQNLEFFFVKKLNDMEEKLDIWWLMKSLSKC
jgi:hypothetical protein